MKKNNKYQLSADLYLFLRFLPFTFYFLFFTQIACIRVMLFEGFRKNMGFWLIFIYDKVKIFCFGGIKYRL